MSEPRDLRPLLATLATPTRPLGQALRSEPAPGGPSPWSPHGAGAGAAPPAIDTTELERAARERGRAEGLAETAALRARLAAAVSALEAAHERAVGLASAQIADATVAAISAWVDAEDRAVRLAPVIEHWLARCATEQGTCARVHPDDVADLRAALADAPLELAADPALRPGDVVIRGGMFELVHRWDDRLRELRELIVAALDAEEPA